MKQKDIERCESFHNGTMSKEDQKAFEKELTSDSGLKEIYDLYKQSLKVIEIEGIKSDIRRIHYDKSNSRTSRNNVKLFFRIAVAASLLIFVSVALFININKESFKQEILNESKPFVDIVTFRNVENIRSTQLMTLYNTGKYQQYIELYEKVENPTEVEIFYAGQSYLAIDQPDLFLESADLMEDSSLFANFIPWYRVVALSKNDVPDKEIYQELLKLEKGNYNFEYGQKLIEKFKDSFSSSKKLKDQ